MLDEKEIEVYDIDGLDHRYIIYQIPAAYAQEMTQNKSDDRYKALLKYSYYDGVCLDSDEKINIHIPDYTAMKYLENEVYYHTFGFLRDWKGMEGVPNISGDFESVRSATVNSIVALVIEERLATLKELRNDYTLLDLMNLWSIVNANRVSNHLAYKAINKESAQNNRRRR